MSVYNTLQFVARHPLNRGRRVRSLWNLFAWQMKSRLRRDDCVYPWVNDSQFSVRHGETAMTGNLYCGLLEFHDMAFLLHLLNAEDVFVDVGANVGSYTVLASAVRGARAYCFEPVPATFARLMDNVRLNHLTDRVTCFNAGVSDIDGHATFTAGNGCENRPVVPGEGCVETVESRTHTLDGILADESPTLLKIDVEGFETPVIRGAEETLKKDSLLAVIMELCGGGKRFGFDENQLVDTMRESGFEPHEYDPFERELQPLDARNTCGNTLFVRDKDRVLARLRSAPRVKVHGSEF